VRAASLTEATAKRTQCNTSPCRLPALRIRFPRWPLKSFAERDPGQFVRTVAGILPAKIDTTLAVDINLFEECRSFAQAFRMARDHIGVDAPLLLEAGAADYV
jgi:hypothetical protein